MKKVITTLAIAVDLISCLAPCSLATNEYEFKECEIMEPRYEVIAHISASLNITSSGRANCGAAVTLLPGYKVDLTAELQQKDGGRWQTIRDWEASGSNRVSVSGPWYVMPGYSYRLRVTATVYDANGNFIESPVEYSPIRDY